MKRFSQIQSDLRGAAVAQYGLIAAVAGVVVAVAALALGSVMTSVPVASASPSVPACTTDC